MPDTLSCKGEFSRSTCQMASGMVNWPKGGVRMKKTVMTVIRVIVIVGVLGLLTYGGFLGMNRVSGNGD